jgi:hypothetical protein
MRRTPNLVGKVVGASPYNRVGLAPMEAFGWLAPRIQGTNNMTLATACLPDEDRSLSDSRRVEPKSFCGYPVRNGGCLVISPAQPRIAGRMIAWARSATRSLVKMWEIWLPTVLRLRRGVRRSLALLWPWAMRSVSRARER